MTISLRHPWYNQTGAPVVFHGAYYVSKRTARVLARRARDIHDRYKGKRLAYPPAQKFVNEVWKTAFFYANGSIQLGCQFIPWADISRFARKQGWFK